jgi:hypothetical protein
MNSVYSQLFAVVCLDCGHCKMEDAFQKAFLKLSVVIHCVPL